MHWHSLYTEFRWNHHRHWGKLYAPDEIEVNVVVWRRTSLISSRCPGIFRTLRKLILRWRCFVKSSNRHLSTLTSFWHQVRNSNLVEHRIVSLTDSQGLVRDATWRNEFCRYARSLHTEDQSCDKLPSVISALFVTRFPEFLLWPGSIFPMKSLWKPRKRAISCKPILP